MEREKCKGKCLTGFAVGLWAILVISFHGSTGLAQGDARETFRRGVALYNEGKFAEAAKSFEKAYKLKPTYKLLFNIGQAYAAGKKYALAIQAFERYLVDGGDNVTDERRDDVLREIGKLRPLVGFLEVKGKNGLTVRVDGVLRGKTPLKGKIMLTVGHSHIVEVLEGDEVVLKRELSVYGGMVETVRVEEKRPERAPKPAEPSPLVPEQKAETIDEQASVDDVPTAKKSRMSTKKLLGIVSLAVGGATLITGGILGAMSLGQDAKLEQACPGGRCSPARGGEVEMLGKLSLGTDVLLGIGGAFAAAGLVLVVLPEKREKGPKAEGDEAASPPEPTISIVPLPSGLAANIRF